MSARDRLVIAVVVVVAIAVIGWLEFVSPERAKVSSAKAKVAAARAALTKAQQEVAAARAAQARYGEAYAAIVSLGKAVPASSEVPSLLYELSQEAGTGVKVSAITVGANGSGSAGTTSSSSQQSGTSFSQLQLNLSFKGTLQNLYRLLTNLERLDTYSQTGTVEVNGRLLTVTGLNLAPASSGNEKAKSGELSGTVTAVAYVLPVGQTVTAGATPAGPAGATPTPARPANLPSGAQVPATIKGLP